MGVTTMAGPVSLDAERDAAIRGLVDRAGRRGFAIAFDLLGDREDARDAVQDALARALAAFGQLRDPEALEGWFLRVLTNGCLRILRRRRILDAILFRTDPRAVAAPRLTADDRRLLAEIERLAPMQKAAVVLRYGHDLGLDEIAGLLGIGAESVKTHLKRGRARLRDRLGVTDEP